MALKSPDETPVKFLKGVGPFRAKALQSLSIHSVSDLLRHFPRRYEDRRHLCLIKDARAGSVFTFRARASKVSRYCSRKRPGFNICRALLEDDSAKIQAVWFNQPFVQAQLQRGEVFVFHGAVREYKGALMLESPEFEIIEPDEPEVKSLNIARIVPVYPLVKFISQRQMRRLVFQAINDYIPRIDDFLSYEIRKRNSLSNLARAIVNIHFPETEKLLDEAYRRMAFDECFFFQLPLILKKARQKDRKAPVLKIDNKILAGLISSLPFELTGCQSRVLEEIKKDISSNQPMQRLLQGDVGSGKTIIALISAIIASNSGFQAALMVPTEIIANQHAQKMEEILKLSGLKMSIAVLTSSTASPEALLKQVKTGSVDLVIGTHALLSEKLAFQKLGLVIIDEQHKFGVSQRAKIAAHTFFAKDTYMPHLLVMSATPIPRTLALTLYADLDVSTILKGPEGRKPVRTIAYNKEESNKAYEFLKESIQGGFQAYIVYPLIGESADRQTRSAQIMYEDLRKSHFKGLRLGLIHGKMSGREQSRIMNDFYQKRLDILVSTSILEVGVDVADAKCILIEESDRFGLATLHQLRGRVGRSKEQSFCLIVSSGRTACARKRIDAIVRHNDGFKIAEIDLDIRGPGEFFGLSQHGEQEFDIINPSKHVDLLGLARTEVKSIVDKDKDLSSPENAKLSSTLVSRFPGFNNRGIVA